MLWEGTVTNAHGPQPMNVCRCWAGRTQASRLLLCWRQERTKETCKLFCGSSLALVWSLIGQKDNTAFSYTKYMANTQTRAKFPHATAGCKSRPKPQCPYEICCDLMGQSFTIMRTHAREQEVKPWELRAFSFPSSPSSPCLLLIQSLNVSFPGVEKVGIPDLILLRLDNVKV